MILLAALALTAACATPKHQGPLLLHPVPPTGEGYALEQGALVFSDPELSVSVRPWDYRLVAEEFRISGEPSPFGDGEEAVSKFLFLRVRLENRSARTLVFNPMRASLLRRGDSPLLPVENSDLFMFAGENIADAETRSRTFRRVSFDAAATVRPGQSLERYLVFRAPAVAPKQLVLELDDLWLGSTSLTPHFTLEPFPAK